MSRREGKVPEESLVIERRARYARFWPLFAGHRSPVPTILQTEPEFKAFEDERKAIFEAQARVRTQVDVMHERNERIKAEYSRAIKEAMDSESPMPPQPEVSPIPPELGLLTHWDDKHKSCEAAEVALLVKRADHWKSRLNVDEAEDRVSAAREALDAAEANLKPLTRAVEAIDRLIQPIRDAEERRARKEAAQRDERPWRGMRSPSSRESVDLFTQLAEAHGRPRGPLTGRR